MFEATIGEVTHHGQRNSPDSLARRGQVFRTVLVCALTFIGAQIAVVVLAAISASSGTRGSTGTIVAVVTTGAAFGVAITATGIRHLRDQRQLVAANATISAAAVRAAANLDAFATEELRVRREVADGLHGTVQHNLVMISVRLAATSRALAQGTTAVGAVELAELADIRAAIDNIREHDVRSMSQLLYPVGIDIGAIAAIRLLVQGLPATIAGKIVISDEIVELEGFGRTSLSIERRLMIVRVVEEAITNALRHGDATSLSIAIGLENGDIAVRVDDDGTGLGEVTGFRGIARLRDRLETLGGSIVVTEDSTLGGVRVVARIPL